jgi:DNA-binding CsgD family transcriptional regulator
VPDWPLVGRDVELALLRDLLTGPEPRGVVLAGSSGVGKTRLGCECVGLAERSDMATAQVTGLHSAARLPFGAVAPLLHASLPEAGAAAVDDRVDLLRRSVAALAERPDGRRLLLFVDDAHLLDDASATLVHQVAATGSAVVLATVRTGEPAPDPVVALWKDGLAERVEISGLQPESIDELLRAVLDGPVDPATAVQFAERCQGNALFLRELVIGALDDGSLQDDEGIWRLGRELEPSSRLVEIVEGRLGRLGEGERALMELVAYGEPLGQDELATLSDPALAEGLERRDLLATHLDGDRLRVHLAHPIYGDVVRARTPAVRAQAIARSLAEAVERIGPTRDEDILRVATWRLLAGGGQADVLLEGATIARWRYDFPLAERLARAARDAGAGFDAALLAAQVASLQGRRDEAEAELVALADEVVDDDSRRGDVAVARFHNAAWSGRSEVPMLDLAGGAATTGDRHDQLMARRLVVVLDTQGPRAAADAARSLVARAGGEALAFACLVGAYGLARLGRLDAAGELTARGDAERRHIDAPLAWYPWWHTAVRCLTLRYAGRFAEAQQVISAHHGEALAEGSAEAQAVFAVLEAGAVGDRGRVDTAVRRAREALVVDQQLDRPVLVRHDRTVGALASALARRADDAADELAALDALGLPRLLRDEVDVLQARAWTAAAAGDLPGACARLHDAADLGEQIGDVVGEAAALHGLARMGRSQDVWERLADVAERIDGDLAPARAAHAAALAKGDAAALEAVSHDFEAMGADLLAAEAAADTSVALRLAGQVRGSAAAERRAGKLAERCEGPVTPALHAVKARARLTPSERETAVLAAGGRTNKEIAEQLFLSPRTVENRLQRVYEKLGISGRTELDEALTVDE